MKNTVIALKKLMISHVSGGVAGSSPLSQEELHSIKPGDSIIRKIANKIPDTVLVCRVDDKFIYAENTTVLCTYGWTFDRKTGIEVDEDIPGTYISHIEKILPNETISE